jgi:hypothetical protein
VVALAMASCGGSSFNGEQNKSAREVVADARAALSHVRSFHFEVEEVTDQGTGSESGDIDIVHKVLQDNLVGPGGAGTVVVTDGESYFKADANLWSEIRSSGESFIHTNATAPPGAANYDDLPGKWLKIPLADNIGGQLFNHWGNPARLADCLLGPASDAVHSNGTVTVQGQQAVEIVDDNQGSLKSPRITDVSLTGTAYPIRMSIGGPKQPGRSTVLDCLTSSGTLTRLSLTLARFNQPVRVVAPSPAYDLTGGGP